MKIAEVVVGRQYKIRGNKSVPEHVATAVEILPHDPYPHPQNGIYSMRTVLFDTGERVVPHRIGEV